MFHLDYKEVQYKNLNTRIELHGDENKPAVDIAITFIMEAEGLDDFNKDLRKLLFQTRKSTDDEGDLLNGLPEENENVIEWRFNDIKNVDWDYEGAGYRFVIWKSLQDDAEPAAADRKEDVVLIQTKVGKVKFMPKKWQCC